MLRILIALIALHFSTMSVAAPIWQLIPDAIEMPAAQTSGKAKINGIDMYYATYGNDQGVPVLLIHGGLAHADIWGAQVTQLMKNYKVIVADTRGHGRSTNDGSEYSYGLLAKDYLALLGFLKVDKVQLVGWSDGANIGYAISQMQPQRLQSHFAHAGNVTLDGVDPAVESNAVFGDYVGKMAADYSTMSPTPEGFDNFVGAVSKMWGSSKPGGLDGVKKIAVPTIVVHSEYDEAILKDHSKRIADLIPEATFLQLDGVSHFAMLQKPEQYSAAIRAFLNAANK